MEEQKCPVCKSNAYIKECGVNYIDCPNCGNLIVPVAVCEDGLEFSNGNGDQKKYPVPPLDHYLYHNKKNKDGLHRAFLGSNKTFENLKKNSPHAFYVSPEDVENWYPKTFAEKVDLILENIALKSSHYGDTITIDIKQARRLFFVDVNSDPDPIPKIMLQTNFFVDYFNKKELIKIKATTPILLQDKIYELKLLPEGWSKVYELQKNQVHNKNIFVSMSYGDKTVSIRDSIREGIKKAGFSDQFLDEIIHNQQIIPYMLKLIRDCKFLIMDISDPNYGAYYEAGYAQGLGKEVIITCRKDVFNKNDGYICAYDKDCNSMEKALKPHFDIMQKQILLWDDEKDLTAKLIHWINELNSRTTCKIQV